MHCSARISWLLLSLLVGLTCTHCKLRPALADSTAMTPGIFDPYTASVIAALIDQKHYSQAPLDDGISSRWLERYLNALDPAHMIFLASDIESFRALRHDLDDDVLQKKARLTTPFTIFERFRTRIAERMHRARQLLDAPVDFTLDEAVEFDRSSSPWPVTEKDADELWRRRIKEELLQGELQERSAADSIEILRKRYDRIDKNYVDMEAIDVLELYMTALTTTLDPHSIYFKPTSSDDFDIELSKSLEGIGASLRTMSEYTVVMELISGGPAEQAGDLQPGDKIVAVAQADQPPVDVVDLRIDKVVKLIRGPKGTEVRLTVIPNDAEDLSERKVISIVRDKVELNDRLASQTIQTVPASDGRSLQLGVIRLDDFYLPRRGEHGPRASEDVRIMLDEFSKQGIDGVVLDLRTNGGGSLPEAVRLAGLFIPTGPVVQVHDPKRGTEMLPDPFPGAAWSGPLIVLTSPLSASASEIVAGAIQDYGRGIIVGASTTHGKGTVQSLIGLAPMVQESAGSRMTEDMAGALKLTTQKFYRVSGASTQFRGVLSDIVLPSPFDGLDILESDLDNALEWDEIPPAPYHPLGDPDGVIERIAKRSQTRRASIEEFQKLEALLEYRTELSTRTHASLVLQHRRTEIEERKKALGIDESDTPEQDTQPPATQAEEEEEKEDAILQETLRILADLIQNA